MPDILSNIAMGFGIALTWQNIGLCLFGCVIGTAIGVLPGIGPLTTMAMILPVTFWLSPVGALIMLSGVFYGAQYGGSTTAILVKIPGETSSVVTVLDGHAMAQRRPCRPGARDRGARIAVRGIGGDAADRDRRPAARQDRAAVSIGGLRLRHVARPGVRRGARARLGAQGHRHDRARRHARPRRHRCVDRRVPDDHGPRRSLRRHRIRSAVDGPVRIGRDHGQSRSCNGSRRAGQDGQRTVADARRSQAIVPGHGARHRGWNGIRNSPRRRPHDRSILGLQPRKEDLEDAGAVRQRRDRRRGGAGIGKQCGRAGVLHSDAQPRHSAQCADGADDRRHDGARHHPRARDHHQAARAVLGVDREHVVGKPDARHPQSAIDRSLGEVAAGALRLSVPDHPDPVLHRHLHAQLQHRRRHRHDGVRRHRLCVPQARL